MSVDAGQTRRPPLISRVTVAPLRYWPRERWTTAAGVGAVAFVLIGEVGQTLPPASVGRMYPVLWWNWVTLVASAVLLGLIAATFLGSVRQRVLGGTGGGAAGIVAAVAMACPVCSPLAIPLLGAGGVLAFLAPDRGWIALAALLVLGVTLLMRLRAEVSCPVPPQHAIHDDLTSTERD